MAVHAGPPAGPVVKGRPPIPRRGLEETLRSWSGQGQLWEALAVGDLIADRAWSARAIERRANRVLFERLRPTLAIWPENVAAWLDALPATSEVNDERTASPGPGVSWARTRIGGWPPRSFVGRRRHRVPATVLATVTRWTLEGLAEVIRDGARPAEEDPGQREALRRAEIGLSLLDLQPLNALSAVRPQPADLSAVLAEGNPWRSLVPVTVELLRAEEPAVLADLALEVVAPFDNLSGRLFHLAVLGELLHALRTAGAFVTSRHPLGDSSTGPAYVVTDAEGREWDLWFEAAGAWRHYRVEEPYPEAASGVPGAGSPLGTDLMLIRPNECALLIECKHSWKAGVVARDGYLQALAYAAEATLLAENVTSVVVGPEGVVVEGGWTQTVTGLVGIINPNDIPALVENAFTS